MRPPSCIASFLLLLACCQPATAQTGTQERHVTRNELSAVRKAAENGDPNAQYSLAVLYSYGANGVAQDYRKAAYWYQKAADQGDALAEQELGELYYKGQGLPQDYARAIYWVRKAANQGDAAAQWDLGLAYLSGKGVQQSNSEAYFWLDIAASLEASDSLQQTVAKSRDEAASRLTPAEISRVQERARKWYANHSAKAEAR